MSRQSLDNGINLLRHLAGLSRQVVSFWRAKLFYRQNDSFIDDKKVEKRLAELQKYDLILPLKGGSAPLWQANTPYLARINNIYELTNEAYPIASLAYSTALEVHKLTDQRFATIHLNQPRVAVKNIPQEPDNIIANTVPPDTSLNDWQINRAPRNTNLTKAWKQYTIAPHKTKNEWIFGTQITEVEGVHVRVSSIEKTLIDGLNEPRYCGGLDEVFKAWVRGLADINIDRIVAYTERYDRSILYQRVGYVCKLLGVSHEKFSSWKKHHTPRGGSRLLNPHQEFENNYDPEWNISINHPIAILENKDADYS